MTALLIILLVLAGAVTAIGGGVLMAQRRRELPGSKKRPQLTTGPDGELLARTIRDLRAGDVVSHEGKDYLVEGAVNYEEDGHRWTAGRLVDGSEVHWLVVGLERGGSVIARLLQEDRETEVSGFPPEVLTVGGIRYTQDKRGTATARATGETGLALRAPAESGIESVERCRWWLYETPGEDTLLVEQWSNEYRVLRGKKIGATVLELMPGS